MKDEPIIHAGNLSKVYNLYERPLDRLKEALHPGGRKYHREFYALRDVSFDVQRGETFGIIGRNGSGKSTLLKILAGVLTPTAGRIQVQGRVSALLELGSGFNPEFTGLENVYLQGTLMGFTRKEMDTRAPAIEAFAEIGEFMHQPVKQYSSGMFVRLAFACAVSVEPEILIVDEALAVGDVFFRNKCFHRFHALKEAGTTILFVSHDIGMVKQLCSRALWLEHAALKMCGDKEEVCRAYFNTILEHTRDAAVTTDGPPVDGVPQFPVRRMEGRHLFPRPAAPGRDDFGSDDAEILAYFICERGGQPVQSLHVRRDYEFHLLGKLHRDLDRLIFGFTLENERGQTVLSCNTFTQEGRGIVARAGEVLEAVFKFRLSPLRQGEYLISPAIASGIQQQHVMLAWRHNAQALHVENPGYNLALLEMDHDDEVRAYASDQIVLT